MTALSTFPHPIVQAIRYALLWYETTTDSAPNGYRDVSDKFLIKRAAFETLMKLLPGCTVEGDSTDHPPEPSWSDDPKKRRGIVCGGNRAKTEVFAAAMRKAGVRSVDWNYRAGRIDVAEFYLAKAGRNGRTEVMSIRYGGYSFGPSESPPALYWEDNGACRIEQRALTAEPYHWFWWRRLYDPELPESKYCHGIW
jgi:hypothetical protein